VGGARQEGPRAGAPPRRDELRATVDRLASSLRPGAAVFIRQLGCTRSIRPFFEGSFWFDRATGRRFFERDRSLWHTRFEIAVKR
jgi:hypothetical protein